MIKELVQFTEHALADPIFSNLGVAPREGLHIVLQVVKTPEQTMIADKPLFAGVFSKKMKSWDAKLDDCAAWSQVAWMVDPNKCFDPKVKAIHSCSPFCFALKRTNLEGGEQYAVNQQEKKSQVYERINLYFSKAVALLDSPEEKTTAEAFRVALNDQTRIHNWLEGTGLFNDVKDGEYVIFYLDLPVEQYAAANQKYKKEKLFNTPDFNFPKRNPEYGSSNWFNGFSAKKPFRMHMTSTFDVAHRITAKEAQVLDDFLELASRRLPGNNRKLFPNPLPVFIFDDERKELGREEGAKFKKAFSLIKQDAISQAETSKSHLEIMEELWYDFREELGNYYLLYIGVEKQKTAIKDFEFVSRFEYQLKEKEQDHWQILNLFKIKEKDSKTELVYPKIKNVGDLQTHVFGKVLANKYRKWDGYFNDIEEKNFDKLPHTLLAFRKYRKAIYDFTYKSMKQSLNGQIFKEIMLAGIDDDLKQGRVVSLIEKLNIWFSLNHHFDPCNDNFKNFFMPNKFQELLSLTQSIADSKEQIYLSDEVEFAFVAGQLIDHLLQQTEAAAPTHTMLEPFALKGTTALLVQEIEKAFQRYGHKLPRSGRGRFEKLMCALQAYNLEIESSKKQVAMKDIKSFMLAGYFAPSIFFMKKLGADGQNQPSSISN